jgi:hypothetical protein
MFHRSSSSSRRISALVCRRFLVDVGKIRHSRPIFLQRPQGSCGTLCCSTSHRICKVSQLALPSSQRVRLLFRVGIYLLLPTLDTCFPSWRCHVGMIHLVRIHPVCESQPYTIPRLSRRKKAYKSVKTRTSPWAGGPELQLAPYVVIRACRDGANRMAGEWDRAKDRW